MDVNEAINIRRANRSLDPVEINDDLINDLAKKAQIAPSCSNKQPWNFIFVKDKEKLNSLFTTLTAGNKWVERASLIIAVFSTPQKDCIINERLYYLFDTGLATAFLILRATELGLVAHPIAGFEEQKVKKVLSIPNMMRVIALIIIGKKAPKIDENLTELMTATEFNKPVRLKFKEFSYFNKYTP